MSEYASRLMLNSHTGRRIQAEDQVQAPRKKL